MSSQLATRVILLTPQGRGAVASLLVAGPQATACVGERFHASGRRPLEQQPRGRILFGRWGTPETGEEVVVCHHALDRVEVHCHGGHAAGEAIIASLVGLGCEVIDWQSWMRSTIGDPLEAAARIALAGATTERTAAILWDQVTGALRRAIDRLARSLSTADTRGAREQAQALLESASLGQHLIEPWRVVLAGQPNVGKSSLINALCGYERAIVHATPGTTRDVVRAATVLDGWSVELADTAGLRTSGEAMEMAGIRLAQQHQATADLVLVVFDASRPWSADDASLRRAWPQALVVHNKHDLIDPASADVGRPDGIFTSAVAGYGITGLQGHIHQRLVPRAPAAGQAVLFLVSQIRLIEQVAAALDSEQSATASALLADFNRACGADC